MTENKDTAWHKRTIAVHGGTARSEFGETSEALFLNSGFVYDTAEAAEARFKGHTNSPDRRHSGRGASEMHLIRRVSMALDPTPGPA